MTRINLKPFDFVIFVLFIAAAIFSFISIKNSSKSEPMLIITAQKTNYIYPLSKDATYKIQGLIGTSIIVVKDGQAFFEESPCPNKTCIQSSRISKNGDWNACLPNEIFIRIQDNQPDIDASAF